jgi:hypothetical protein
MASVLVLPTLGTANVLRVAPPLVITEQQIEAAMDGIETVVSRLDRNPVQTIIRALGVLDRGAPEIWLARDAKAAPIVMSHPRRRIGAGLCVHRSLHQRRGCRCDRSIPARTEPGRT